MQLIPGSLLFGMGAGIAIGLSYYLMITVFEPDYLQKALDASYKSWTARGYSEEAIASQWELTEAFRDPLRHSLAVASFYCLLTSGLSFIMGWMTRPSLVGIDDLKKKHSLG